MHRPLIQVMAVIVSISLVVAGVGTVLEILLVRSLSSRHAGRLTGARRARRMSQVSRAQRGRAMPPTAAAAMTHGLDPTRRWRAAGARRPMASSWSVS